MTDVTNMTDEQLAEAQAEMIRRAAEAAKADRDARRAELKCLTDVGIGSTGTATVAEIIAALDASLQTLPRDLYNQANAALLNLSAVHDRILALATEPPVLPPLPTPAAP